jgi:uncharacterized protein (DUF488 family)
MSARPLASNAVSASASTRRPFLDLTGELYIQLPLGALGSLRERGQQRQACSEIRNFSQLLQDCGPCRTLC